MRVMVTGGAGYIGAHTVSLLVARGDEVVVVDDLVSGRRERIPGIPLVEVDLASDAAPAVVAAALREHRIDAVIHFAARKQVEESVRKPLMYYRDNLGGLANLLRATADVGIERIVFSSSAAVYGSAHGAVDENTVPTPINPYGQSKLAGEWLMSAASAANGFAAASLRYFNVAGAGRPEFGDTATLNLVPIVFERLDAGEAPLVFGGDYDTPDGTCIRDYVHVLDVAEAHLTVLDALGSRAGEHLVYNIGTGIGTSVLQMIEAIESASGLAIEPTVVARRPGDPADVVAKVDRIREDTGWRARFTLEDIVRSAWDSHEYFALHAV
jgi:UDP-glucose 4-epimerase